MRGTERGGRRGGASIGEAPPWYMRASKEIVDAVDDAVVSTEYERSRGGERGGCHGRPKYM